MTRKLFDEAIIIFIADGLFKGTAAPFLLIKIKVTSHVKFLVFF